MPDIASISAAWASMKAASELAKALFDSKVDAAAKDQILEMRGLIASSLDAVITAKEELQAARDAEREARDKLVHYENWLDEKARYQLTAPSGHPAVYALKESQRNSEPPHYLCTNCYESAKKSILHGGISAHGYFTWNCPGCKTAYPTRARGDVTAEYAQT